MKSLMFLHHKDSTQKEFTLIVKKKKKEMYLPVEKKKLSLKVMNVFKNLSI